MEEPQCAARDTSVEGRLGDLENTVRNHLVVYDRLMQSTERAFDKLLKRIEELEANTVRALKEDATRLEALERGDMLVSQSRERDRQARWHDTYNAALNYALSITYQHVQTRSDHIARAHEYAAEHADRAHGPLEGEAETWTSDLEKRMRVDALVKAARAAERDLRNALSKLVTYGEDWQSADNLAEALKPFEVTP